MAEKSSNLNDNKSIIVYYDEKFSKLSDDDKEKKLKSYFENKSLTNGGSILRMNPNYKNKSTPQMFIDFKETSVAERVCQQQRYVVGSYEFKVKLNQRSKNQNEEKPGSNTQGEQKKDDGKAQNSSNKQPTLKNHNTDQAKTIEKKHSEKSIASK